MFITPKHTSFQPVENSSGSVRTLARQTKWTSKDSRKIHATSIEGWAGLFKAGVMRNLNSNMKA